MRGHIKTLILRSLKYKGALLASIFGNIMVALATVVSIPSLMPLFNLLFEEGQSTAAVKGLNLKAAGGWFDLQAYLQQFYSQYFANIEPEQGILRAVILILSIYFVKNIFQYIVYISSGWLRINVGKDIRDDLFQKTINLPLSILHKDRKGDIITRISADVKMIEEGFFSLLETLFKSPIIIIGALIIMVGISSKLTLFVFGLVLFTVFVIGGISRALRKQSSAAQSKLGELLSLLEESVTGIKTIKAYFAQDHVFNLFKRLNTSYVTRTNRILLRRHLSSPLSEFLGITVVALLLWFGSRMVFAGEMASSIFFTYIFAFYQIIDPAKKFSSAFYRLQEALGAYDRIDEYLRRPDEALEKRFGNHRKEDLSQGVSLENVSFSYPDSDQQVLDSISLVIPKGSTVAFVGQSGSGKTTLADLLCRFVSPTEGTIKFDDVPLEDIAESSLRNLIALVQQEAILFNDDVRNNVLFGLKDKSEEDIMQALKQSYADEFIDKLESGIETSAGERGSRFSGGQRQRLSLARAILRDTPILILDEATSALDSQSEKYVQEALAYLTKDRTSIIIAHRLGTIQHVDCIFVLDEGRIVEQGKHEELMKQKGVYAQFVELQKLST